MSAESRLINAVLDARAARITAGRAEVIEIELTQQDMDHLNADVDFWMLQDALCIDRDPPYEWFPRITLAVKA